MSRRKISHSHSENAGTAEKGQNAAEAKTATAAKVTLVKPVQEEDVMVKNTEAATVDEKTQAAPAPKSSKQTRPKVGRNFAAPKTPDAENKAKETPKEEIKEEKKESVAAIPPVHIPFDAPEPVEAAVSEADTEGKEWEPKQEFPRIERLPVPDDLYNHMRHSHSLDFKTVLFQVALFVLVIFGLIGVVSHYKSRPVQPKTAMVQEREVHIAPAETAGTLVTPRSRLELEGKPAVLPPALSQTPPVAGTQPLLDLPPVSAPAASVAPAVPAVAMPDLPVTAQPAPPVPVAPALAAPAPAKPIPAPQKVNGQDLLSIINKE